MKSAVLVLSLGLGLAMSSACSKKSDSNGPTSAASEETKIKLSGQLALTGTSAGLRLTDPALIDLSVYCVTFTLPPIAGTGSIAADGKFEVTLEASGVSVGCFILDAEKAILGTMVFKDQAKKDLNGAASAEDRFALEGGASNLGQITLNLSTGKAEVDVAQIVGKLKNTDAAVVGAYDFTGSYVFEASGATAPSGYANLCTEAEAEAEKAAMQNQGGRRRCDGPTVGFPIYMKRINGVVPGTATPTYAMSFWASKAYDVLCGSKLGVTYAEGIEHGIDATASGVAQGEFTWDPLLEDGWKDTTNARAKNSLLKQETVANFNGFPGFKQYFSQYRSFTCTPGQPCSDGAITVAAGFTFNANTIDSGCRDADGKSIQFNDWSNMTCTNENLEGGLHKNVCSKTVESKVITCTHIGGTFLDNGTPLQNATTRFPQDFVVLANGAYCDRNNNSQFDGDEFPMFNREGASCPQGGTLVQGQLCSSISTSSDDGKLAQLRCYAEGKDSGSNEDELSTCRRDVRTNWAAKTPAEFVVGGKSRPKGQFVFEKLKYDSPTSASLRQEESDFRGIQVGDSWTDCEIKNVFSFSVRKVEGAEDLYGEMVSTETNVSPKPACIAEFGASAPTKYMFRMKKQNL